MSRTVLAGQEGELEIKTYLIRFLPRDKPYWAERSLYEMTINEINVS